MELKQYIRALQAQRLVVAACIALALATAAAVAWTRTPVYEAQAELFVSIADASNDSQTYQGGLFAQQRVLSYAQIVSSPIVAESVIRQLRLRTSIERLRSKITATVPLNTVLIEVTVADREPRTAKAIADAVARQFVNFVDRLEAPASGGTSPIKVTVTSPAPLPAAPVSPRKPLYLAAGLLFGLALGVAAALAFEAREQRIRGDNDARSVAQAPILGRVAADARARKTPVVMMDDPGSPRAEAYRQLRINLESLGVGHGMTSLVVSSPAAGEGKTVIAANLGLAFAQGGLSVVIVDADLRLPRLAEALGIGVVEDGDVLADVGLSDVLAGSVPIESALRRHNSLPLHVLTSGPVPSNPSELLASPQFVTLIESLTSRADVVIFDSSALLPVSDGALLARLTSAVVLVARVGATRACDLGAAMESLRGLGKEPLGIVLNGVSAPQRSRYDPRQHRGRRRSSPARDPATWRRDSPHGHAQPIA